jgi:uncharacterized protein YqjF (DUF2071 family)
MGNNHGVSGLGFLDDVARQAQAAADVSQRPWMLPEGPWAQAETREDLVLAHWAVAPEELARFVPPELELELFAGKTWLGVVAFRVCNLRVRGLPPLPGLSSSLELEIRTYVTDGKRPGLWLLSLDATNRVLVEAAKRIHRLPAYAARIELDVAADTRRLDTQRDGRRFGARFECEGTPVAFEPGTFDHFVCERYCVYTSDGGRLYRAERQHSPWRLREARVSVERSELIPVSISGAPLACCASSQDMLVWPSEEV